MGHAHVVPHSHLDGFRTHLESHFGVHLQYRGLECLETGPFGRAGSDASVFGPDAETCVAAQRVLALRGQQAPGGAFSHDRLSHDIDRIDAQTAGFCSGGSCLGAFDFRTLVVLLGLACRQCWRNLLAERESEAAHVGGMGGAEGSFADQSTAVMLDMYLAERRVSGFPYRVTPTLGHDRTHCGNWRYRART